MLSVGVALVLCIALWAFWPRSESNHPAQAAATPSATTALAPANPSGPAESARTPSSLPGASAAGRPSAKRRPSAEQQQLRARVVQSLRQREGRGGTPATAASATGGSSSGEPDHVPGEGTMKDKTGLMGDEVKVVNRELMPMVDQCIDEAHERDPRLHGMLALGVKLASAEGVGSIFETVEPTATNEVLDPEMIDCIRQSAFTISLPMPKANSLHEAELTIPIDAAPDAG
jgi:hypothetical protein